MMLAAYLVDDDDDDDDDDVDVDDNDDDDNRGTWQQKLCFQSH